MKKSILILLLTMTIQTYSQESEKKDEQQIIAVINKFFESLEKKDSLMMRQTTMDEAQIWRRYSDEKPARADFRYSKEFLPKMHSLPNVKEIALDFDINIHKGMASAWVPYEFYIDEKFSHCGVDIFTLFEMDGHWKIISVAYTVEMDHCEELKQKK